MKKWVPAVAGVVVLIAPHVAAAALVPCTGLSCEFCDVAKLIQGIINFLIQLSIPLSAALFAYAGFLYATAGISGKPNQTGQAKTIFVAVGGGFVFTLIGWLVINTFLTTLLGGGPYANGKWFEIPCVGNARNIAGSNMGTLLNGLTAGTPNTSGLTAGGGAGNGDIAAAAAAYQNTNTSGGPDGGNLACAWAVNNVLKNAGIPPIDGDSVPAMEQALAGGRGTQVQQSGAQAGDIVILGGMSHVGICYDANCTQVISNSSSNATFSSMYPPTAGSHFYRVNK